MNSALQDAMHVSELSPSSPIAPKTTALAVGGIAGALLTVLAGVTSPLIAAAALVGSLVAAACMYWPFLSVLLTAAVVPLERVGRFTNDNAAVTFSIMRVLGLLGLSSLLLHACVYRKRLRLTLPVLLYSAYVFVCILTLTYSTDAERGAKWCATMVGNCLFLFFVANVFRSSRQVRLTVVFWLASTFAIGAYTIYEWHFGTAVIQDDRFANSGYRTTDDRFSTVILDYAELDTIGVVKRVLGATSHPAVYAINVIMTLPFYVYLLVTTGSWWMRSFSIAGLGVAAYNILLTNTRAAVVAMVLIFALIFFSSLVRHRVVIALALLIAGACAAPFLPADLYHRVLSVKNYSTSNSAAIRIRLNYWRAGVDMFADHWFMGIGSGNQSELPARLANERMPPNTSIHNEFIESLLETGILGYPLIAGFVIVLFRRCLAVTRRAKLAGNKEMYLFGVATVITFTTVLAYGLQCDVLHFTLKGWWLLMGIMVALSEMPMLPAADAALLRSNAMEEALA